MTFTSLSFYAFVALTAIIYFNFPIRYRWTVLLVSSLFFYAFAGLFCLIFIFSTIITTFSAANIIFKMRAAQDNFIAENESLFDKDKKKKYKEKEKHRRFLVLAICLTINFGVLFTLKYLDAALLLFNQGAKALGLVLPLGISFYTFQSAGYVIDVYYGKYKPEGCLPKYALFISFFPQLVQGPICRYNITAPSMINGSVWDSRRGRFSIERILWGCFKKLVVADRIVSAVIVLTSDSLKYNGIIVLVGMLFYALQLYCDFTGGIDIAIGIGELFGVKLSENFERPFFSKSIAEYWRRWHITLGTWFKDYTFYPLSTCKPMMYLTKRCGKLFGSSVSRRFSVYISTIVLWIATGIWHGAGWNFIFWGLGNCFIILLSQELNPLYIRFKNKFPALHSSGFWKAFQISRTFVLMCFLRSFDCYRSVRTTFGAWASLLTDFNFRCIFDASLMSLGLDLKDYLVIAFSTVLIFTVSMLQRKGSVREMLENHSSIAPYTVIATFIFIILIFGAYGINYDETQFIYSQF